MQGLKTLQRGPNGPSHRRKSLFDTGMSVLVGLDAVMALRQGPAAIRARQERRLTEMVAFARERSPYYRSLYAHLPPGFDELSLAPPTRKEDLMENFDGWVTDPAVSGEGVRAHLADQSLIGKPFLGRYLVWTSSGTTGTPAAFVQDRRTLAVMAAMSIARGPAGPREFLRIKLRGNRRAGLYGVGGHLQGAVLMGYLQSNPRWSDRFSGLSVLAPLPDLVGKLNDFRPAVLGGYASTLSLLAEEQQAGRLRIDPVLVLSGAEGLPPKARERIEGAFGCTVRDYYGTSEASGLTYDCGQGSLHLNADWFVLEPVDEDYEPVPVGEVSHTALLTNLANRIQPLIRYDLGDRVALKPEGCPCGSPLPALWVEGRRNELISFPDQDGRPLRLPPRALFSVIDFTPGVRRCQAIKTGARELRVRLEAEAGAEEGKVAEEALGRARGYLRSQGLGSVAVRRDPEAPCVDPKTGKFRHVWSEAEEDHAHHEEAPTW